jgi:5-methylcytosine-specific restriction endonuclease McrA
VSEPFVRIPWAMAEEAWFWTDNKRLAKWLRERLENLPRRVSRPITEPEWLAILDRYGHRCVYCGQYGRLVRDHRMPLALGGANSPENIVPACRSCNQRKHAQHPDRWPMVVEPKA